MRRLAFIPALLFPFIAPVQNETAWAQTRQLDAHVHGEGELQIAVEGSEVAMELKAPGADIVGFEHQAKTDADRAAVNAATARLAEPLSMFVLPAAAGCAVSEVEVEFEVDDSVADKPTHAEFHAEYQLVCQNPAAIDAIDFAYFEAFPAARALDVSLVSDKGQRAFEATREARTVSLAGAI